MQPSSGGDSFGVSSETSANTASPPELRLAPSRFACSISRSNSYIPMWSGSVGIISHAPYRPLGYTLGSAIGPRKLKPM